MRHVTRVGRIAPAVVCLFGLAGAGCGSADNRLTGSLADSFDLSFDSVAGILTAGGTYLVVEYRVAATGSKAIKLAVDLTGYTIVPGAEIDLAAAAASGLPRGTLEQIATVHTAFPFDRGGLTVDAVPGAGAPLGGSFHAAITSPSGRSLQGYFKVPSIVAQ